MTRPIVRLWMKEKVIKASNTNGLKQEIFKIIDDDQNVRKFTRFEVLNALNAIGRTDFYIRQDGKMPKRAFKYTWYREVRDGSYDKLYKLEYITGYLTLILS